MCGIAGFLGFDNVSELCEKANEIQFHRGPDFQGKFIQNSFGLAHQRLSIIDLDPRSNQPMIKDDLVIAFNGEIYNFKELRAELEVEGVRFDTCSDTEVVLEGYRKWGIRCLDKIVGMFAFCVFSKKNESIFIARDHFGIKPLFYSDNGSEFCFSSELKTLVKTGVISKKVNMESLINSLNFLWIPGNQSMFEGVFKLPPGHFLTKNKNESCVVKKYWEVDENENREEDLEKLREQFLQSLDRHLIADVPVSSFLSGGLDSSLISVLAKNKLGSLDTYTIGTSDEDKKIERMPEDEKYASILAKKHEFNHNEIIIKPNIIKDLRDIVYLLDEPIGDPAAINTYLICKAAKQKGSKVLLSGMGADEIMFGYRRQKATLLAEKYKRIPKLIRFIIEFFVKILPVKVFGKGFKLGRWAKRFVSFASLPTDEAYLMSYSYYNERDLQNLLLSDHGRSIRSIKEKHKVLFHSKYKGDIKNQICNTDINMFMVGLNLTYTDRASMGASVEVRVPFIDKHFITSAMKVPGELKFKNEISKYPLKHIAEKYLPHDIIYRPKASFGAPIRSWISNELKPLVDELLSKENVNRRGVFNYDYIKKLIDSDRKGLEDNAYRIYQLLTVELWYQEFVD